MTDKLQGQLTLTLGIPGQDPVEISTATYEIDADKRARFFQAMTHDAVRDISAELAKRLNMELPTPLPMPEDLTVVDLIHICRSLMWAVNQRCAYSHDVVQRKMINDLGFMVDELDRMRRYFSSEDVDLSKLALRGSCSPPPNDAVRKLALTIIANYQASGGLSTGFLETGMSLP